MLLSRFSGVSKEALIEVGSVVTVAAKALVRMLKMSGFCSLGQDLLSNHPKRRRQLTEARGASPLMRERRD